MGKGGGACERRDCTQQRALAAQADLSQGATLETVDKLMREYDPHILWFVGHGNAQLAGELTLCWTTEDGGMELIDPRVDVLHAS